MIRFIILFFKPFRRVIEKMGADFNQFISILHLKLTLDDRRFTGFGFNSNNSKNEVGNSILKQSFFQIFFGLLLVLFLGTIDTQFVYYYILHSFLMVMMAMMIITQFTTILFDTSENVIIQPLPIKGSTLSLARIAHVFIYLTIMAFNLSIVSIGFAIYKFGIVSGIFLIISIFLNVLITLFLANILYLVIMRLANGEKLKNILMYFQIAIAIFFMAFYQIGIRLIDMSKLQNMIVELNWYSFLIPPTYLAGFVEGLSTFSFDIKHIIFIAEATIIPPVVIYFTGKYLTPIFNRKLLEIEQGDKVSKVINEKSTIGIWCKFMSFLFVRSNNEKPAFQLMWKMCGRERLFLQTLLPSFGFVVIFMVMPHIRKSFDYTEFSSGKDYLMFLYILVFVAVSIPTSLLVGNNKNAAWIFRTIPFESPAVYFKAFIKAPFAKFFMPFYFIVSCGVLFVWGIKTLPDVFIAFMLIYIFTVFNYYIQNPTFPFAMEKVTNNSGSVFIKTLLLFIVIGLMGFLHYLILNAFAFASLILVPIYASVIYYINFIWVYEKITWEKVDLVNKYS